MEKYIVSTFTVSTLAITIGFLMGLTIPSTETVATFLITGGFFLLVLTLALIIISFLATIIEDCSKARANK